jgi:hypothetical protein
MQPTKILRSDEHTGLHLVQNPAPTEAVSDRDILPARAVDSFMAMRGPGKINRLRKAYGCTRTETLEVLLKGIVLELRRRPDPRGEWRQAA